MCTVVFSKFSTVTGIQNLEVDLKDPVLFSIVSKPIVYGGRLYVQGGPQHGELYLIILEYCHTWPNLKLQLS